MFKQNDVVNRSYYPGDEDQIFELVKAVWGQKLKIPMKNLWVEGWQWLFTSNLTDTPIIWLAEYKGDLIAEYPLLIMDMKVGNRLVKAGQIVDTMTHPQYRRKGIAFTLGSKSLGQLKEKNAMLAFGFPTAEAYLLHMKSGWIDICAIQTMIRPLNLKKIVQTYITYDNIFAHTLSKLAELAQKTIFRVRRPSTFEGLTISKVSQFDDRYNNFWDTVSKDYRIIVVRSKNYLNWRYIDVPNAKYDIYVAEKNKNICGYIVLEQIQYKGLVFGRILDVIAPLNQQSVVQCLIAKAVEHFEQKEVDAILSSIIANRYRYSFLKNGFIPYHRSTVRFIAYKASPDISDKFIKNSDNWFIQLGDLPMVF